MTMVKRLRSFRSGRVLRHRSRERRVVHHRGEQRGELRPRLAPRLGGEAEIQVAERAGHRDASRYRHAGAAGRASSASTVRSTAAFCRAIHGVARILPRLGHLAAPRSTAASRMPSAIACCFSARQRARATRGEHRQRVAHGVEVLADHRAVEQRQPVIGDQARHLRQRVVGQQLGGRVVRVGRDQLDRASSPRVIAQAITFRTKGLVGE